MNRVEGVADFPSLGWAAVAWIEAFLRHGPGDIVGDPITLDDEFTHFVGAPRVPVGPPGVLERIAPQVRGREGKRVQELDLAVGHHQQHGLRASAPRAQLSQDIPGIGDQGDPGVALGRALQLFQAPPPLLFGEAEALPGQAAAPPVPRQTGFP